MQGSSLLLRSGPLITEAADQVPDSRNRADCDPDQSTSGAMSLDSCALRRTQALATAQQERDAATKKLAETERRVVQMAKKRQAEHSAKVF